MNSGNFAGFCNAIRAKDGWVVKLLNEQQNLATKWAMEAGLWSPGTTMDEGLAATIEELKAEARRIRAIDLTVDLSGTRRLPERQIPFQDIHKDVSTSVCYQRASKYGLRDPGLKDIVGVFVSDGIVPPSLHAELVTELDALAALEPKDFHPGTNGTVQDLIHPSLYPYIALETPVHDGVRLPPFSQGRFATQVFHSLTESLGDAQSLYHISKYAWIPSVFRISEDGKSASIDSYINGLGPRKQYPNLYRIIEELFICCLPHFERTMNTPFERQDSPSGGTQTEWNAIRAKQQQDKERERVERLSIAEQEGKEMLEEWEQSSTRYQVGDEHHATSFKGRSLKVIVKAANYILRPGQIYQGTWHLEGMPHERIVSSVIYYYSTDDSIVDHGLGMRRARDEELDYPEFTSLHRDSYIIQVHPDDPDEEELFLEDYPSSDAEECGNAFVPLGTVATTYVASKIGHGTGRIISFPNWIQHKVLGITNKETSGVEPAQRKILCFFLVDDSNPEEDEIEYPGMAYTGLQDQVVLTTSDIPPQQRATNLPTLHVLLPWVCQQITGKRLPPNLVDLISSSGALGLTREMAEYHRHAFMEDRKIKVSDENEMWESQYSLCEH
ncbi:hypothetical protein HGRIS_006392 [Hohenbuehelia grisea]|uniref:DUF4246 domain-containing protein n=1 Tax=Hohenbuehelia grisea TaxID=104357 RepID=A0ABR3K0P1_9AGAR